MNVALTNVGVGIYIMRRIGPQSDISMEDMIHLYRFDIVTYQKVEDGVIVFITKDDSNGFIHAIDQDEVVNYFDHVHDQQIKERYDRAKEIFERQKRSAGRNKPKQKQN
jgi:hypothetical protein